jgi:hypothetical protein
MQTVYYGNDIAVLLSKKVKRTQEQRLALLVKAKILDEKGNYLSEFFREETVQKNKERHLISAK